MRVGCLLSGGKDSISALHYAASLGHYVVCGITMMPPRNVRELDSHMFQSCGIADVTARAIVSSCLAIPLVAVEIRNAAVDLSLHYTAPKEESAVAKSTCENVEPKNVTPAAPTTTVSGQNDEVEDLFRAIQLAKEMYNIEAVASGAIWSKYQKNRVENICRRLGLVSLAPLWHLPQQLFVQQLVNFSRTSEGRKQRRKNHDADIFAECERPENQPLQIAVLKVAGWGLTADDVGLTLTQLHSKLLSLEHINAAGEGGEFETLVLRAPGYVPGRAVQLITPPAPERLIDEGAGAVSLNVLDCQVTDEFPVNPEEEGAAALRTRIQKSGFGKCVDQALGQLELYIYDTAGSLSVLMATMQASLTPGLDVMVPLAPIWHAPAPFRPAIVTRARELARRVLSLGTARLSVCLLNGPNLPLAGDSLVGCVVRSNSTAAMSLFCTTFRAMAGAGAPIFLPPVRFELAQEQQTTQLLPETLEWPAGELPGNAHLCVDHVFLRDVLPAAVEGRWAQVITVENRIVGHSVSTWLSPGPVSGANEAAMTALALRRSIMSGGDDGRPAAPRQSSLAAVIIGDTVGLVPHEPSRVVPGRLMLGTSEPKSRVADFVLSHPRMIETLFMFRHLRHVVAESVGIADGSSAAASAALLESGSMASSLIDHTMAAALMDRSVAANIMDRNLAANLSDRSLTETMGLFLPFIWQLTSCGLSGMSGAGLSGTGLSGSGLVRAANKDDGALPSPAEAPTRNFKIFVRNIQCPGEWPRGMSREQAEAAVAQRLQLVWQALVAVNHSWVPGGRLDMWGWVQSGLLGRASDEPILDARLLRDSRASASLSRGSSSNFSGSESDDGQRSNSSVSGSSDGTLSDERDTSARHEGRPRLSTPRAADFGHLTAHLPPPEIVFVPDLPGGVSVMLRCPWGPYGSCV